ncbi:pentatricopeptide repeat-containing protein At2g20710, mitochondrial-like [Mercurialis annua]|uniref:pentatricopeptide repeat-containing protein At2g20710, mitochondrial-like n=1 Tax=Mercurialis annua TaxID=3986 RepID=UPI00215F2EA5|nr:pentatricopeptide repeat-containing protein At2g20710, mitochondrial-like [Mercurialis annua]
MKLTKSITTVITRLSTSLLYSTATPFLAEKGFRRHGGDQLKELYRRISPVGDPKQSIVPILDKWIDEGRTVDKEHLQTFIKELRKYKRYSHALQISMWMSDKRYLELTRRDVAVRLDLMSKVHGIEQVEKYFDTITQQLKGLEVYGALLNCYAYAKSVDKAEAVMQKMRDLGFAKMTLSYNVMLNLYSQTGQIRKFDALSREMEENGIVCDAFTHGIQVSAYAAISDIEGMEKTMTRMESDTNIVRDWCTYAIMANGYTKAGLVDKAVEMLKKSEGLITSKTGSKAYEYLLTQYASIGKKDEVLRIWKLYQDKHKVYNKGYICMIPTLLKFDDFESAEQIFMEWESQNQYYDMRIPNFMIRAYSRKGLVDKAETFVDRVISKGEEPDGYTWYYLATGYLQNNQTQKAVETMKKAIAFRGTKLKPSSESLAYCLECLRDQGDLEKAEEFVKLLLDNDLISLEVQEQLLSDVKAVRL